MSFPAYDEYKDSGVGWLGEIPSGWDVVALKYIVSLKSGDGITGESIEESGEYPVYGGNGLRGYTDDFTHDGHYVVVGRQGALCGNINYANGRFWASEHAVVASPLKSMDTIWLGEMLRAMNLNQYSVSAAQPGLSMELVGNLRTMLPPEDEQKAISSFLDVETSKIDGLVSEQRRLIELLKEKRQAVISHAVTKGLNPNAPMKPSGIQWLGDVPEHWKVKPLKYLATFRSGGTPSKTVPAYWHGDVPWASSKDLKTETLADTIDHITQHALDTDAAALVPAGSVLVVVRGMILLHTFPVVQTLVPMAINQDLKSLTPAECIHASYLPCLLRGSTDATFGRIDEAAHGTKVLRMEGWTSIKLPVPPIEEQLEIVEAVEKQLATLSQLQAEAERSIELLQERRTALISAAVTGKIDVRNS